MVLWYPGMYRIDCVGELGDGSENAVHLIVTVVVVGVQVGIPMSSSSWM